MDTTRVSKTPPETIAVDKTTEDLSLRSAGTASAGTASDPLPSSSASPSRKLSREDEARLALEHTRITPTTARTLCLLFLLTIVSVPLIQFLAALSRPSSTPAPGRFQSKSVIPGAQELKRFEKSLEDNSVAVRWLLPRAQSTLVRLGVGNEKAYIGRDKWLIYRPDVDYVTSRGFLDSALQAQNARNGDAESALVQSDPMRAIVRFREQLAQRGIQLIVLPTPLKPMLHPEALQARYSLQETPLQNPSYTQFLREMARHKVWVCDPTARLMAAKRSTGQAQFLKTDTHWTPAAMQLAAGEVAEFIRQHITLPSIGNMGYTRQSQELSNQGDIAAMLRLADNQRFYARQQISIERIETPKGQPWKASPTADVLLMGDSFSTIFSHAAMGWGQSAGLAEHISFEMQRPLDVIAINAGGSSATRRRLRDELLRGQDRLAGKRVVIWQFAMRDLLHGDWATLDLPSTARTRPDRLLPGTHSIPSSDNASPLRMVQPNPQFLRELKAKAAGREDAQANVLRGEAGWLYHLSDVYYSTNSGFLRGNDADAPQIRALIDFKRQLGRRGIRLMVVPLPVKTMIYPEHLGLATTTHAQSDGAVAVAQNPSFARYRRALESAGISVFDPTETLLRAKAQARVPLFIPGDAHWSFEGMDTVAGALTDAIKSQIDLPSSAPVAYMRRSAPVQHTPDLWRILQRATGKRYPVKQRQTVQRVFTSQGTLWKASRQADILLMGDSFANIYSHGGPWGTAAGLSEQLSYHLQRPLDKIVIEGGGMNETREELRDRMLRDEDVLAGKRLVVYEFTSRYLMLRKWKTIRLPKVQGTSPGVAKIATNQTARSATVATPSLVRAQIKALATVPDPNSSPYPDLVMAVRLTNLQIIGSDRKNIFAGKDILVYLWGMRDHKLTDAAAWQAGQSITLRLQPWEAVQDQYGSYSRAEIGADDAAPLPQFWGEVKQ